jgi:AraC family transcriptional regulator
MEIRDSRGLDVTALSRPSTTAGYLHAVERVIDVMHRRMTEDWTLESLAELAWMSSYHFNRIFHRMTGLPPCQFLAALRLERAKRLLLTTERSVTEICFEVGYASLGSFTSRFTQMVGLSPTQLRLLSQGFCQGEAPEISSCLFPEPSAEATVLRGKVEPGAGVGNGPIFVGLFPHPVPQSRPLGCTMATAPGPYALEVPGEGRYFLLAARWPDSKQPLEQLLDAGPREAVAAAGPIVVDRNGIHGNCDLELRQRTPFDPPLLVALPLLLAERLANLQASAGAPRPTAPAAKAGSGSGLGLSAAAGSF